MNEVKKVHLGRQAYVISVSAHTKLKAYLRDIEAASSDKGVTEEVELRMAELLTERGVTGEKVVLDKDIDFLQQQLGKPSDFQDDETERIETVDQIRTRRLYRDPSRGYVAGVAVGLADYFGIDVVIVRVILLALSFASGFGLFLYVVLWLLVPVAKTQSERLQMQGKPVTVESLTNIVKNPELADTTRKLARKTRYLFAKIIRVSAAIVGIGVVLASVAGLVALVAVTSAVISHGVYIEQVKVFPLGGVEVALVVFGAITIGLILLLVAQIGGLIIKRKRAVPVWVTAVFVALIVVTTAITVGLGAGNAKVFQDRFDSIHYSVTRVVPAFDAISVRNADITVVYEPSNETSVELKTIGFKDYDRIKTDVFNGELVVDGQLLDSRSDCVTLCTKEPIEVVVRGPHVSQVSTNGRANVSLNGLSAQKELELIADNVTNQGISFTNIHAESYAFDLRRGSVAKLVLTNPVGLNDGSSVYMTSAAVHANLHARTSVLVDQGCTDGDSWFFLDAPIADFTVNNVRYDANQGMSQPMKSKDAAQRLLPQNCIYVGMMGESEVPMTSQDTFNQ